jgi:hypothetical protein
MGFRFLAIFRDRAGIVLLSAATVRPYLVRPAWRDGGGAPSAHLAGDGNFPDEFPFQEFCRELTKKLIS